MLERATEFDAKETATVFDKIDRAAEFNMM